MRKPTITPEDLNELARRVKPYSIGGALQQPLEWENERNIRYVSLRPKGALDFVLDPDIIPEGLVAELVQVKGELARHHHLLVDSVVIAYDAGEVGGKYCVDDGEWTALADMQVIDLPRGRKHGFMVGEQKRPYYLLVLSNDENTEADTYYG